jgi:iron-regulated transporter 1
MSQQVDKHEPISSEEEQATPDNSKAEEWLSATNVTMRQIDLTCKVCAPAIAGLILGKALSEEATDSNHLTGLCDLQGATFFVGSLNLMALAVEYICSAKVYYLIPALAVNKFSRRDNKQTKSSGYQSVEVSDEQTDRQESFEDEEDLDQTQKDTATELMVNGNSCCNSVIVYMQQPVALAGLSFAAIWVNSLSFGGFMTEYLLSREMPIEEVGVWRSIASFTGLLGTFAYQISTKYTSVVNTGQISVVYLFGCLSVAVASFLVEDNTLATYMLVVSCALSRVGLWVYDIVVTLLFQEFVPDGVRGLVGGTQNAFNSFGVVLVGVMGLVFRKPEDFYIFGAVSYFGSCTCAILYTVGVFRRGHKLKVLRDSR